MIDMFCQLSSTITFTLVQSLAVTCTNLKHINVAVYEMRQVCWGVVRNPVQSDDVDGVSGTGHGSHRHQHLPA